MKNENTKPVVFIAGGIGITPFYSMIQFATASQSAQKIYLFYGNQHAEDAILISELTNLEKINPNSYTLISTLAIPHDSWCGEVGYVNENNAKKNILLTLTSQHIMFVAP